MKKASLTTPISPCLLIEGGTTVDGDAGMLCGAAEVRAERIELFGEDSDSEVGEVGDAGENQVEIVANVDHGIRAPRMKKIPRLPSKRIIEEHNITHIPFADWCWFCVASRGRNCHHKKAGEQEPMCLPCISMDYSFYSQEDEKACHNPIFNMCPSQHKSVFSRAVGEKGLGDVKTWIG